MESQFLLKSLITAVFYNIFVLNRHVSFKSITSYRSSWKNPFFPVTTREMVHVIYHTTHQMGKWSGPQCCYVQKNDRPSLKFMTKKEVIAGKQSERTGRRRLLHAFFFWYSKVEQKLQCSAKCFPVGETSFLSHKFLHRNERKVGHSVSFGLHSTDYRTVNLKQFYYTYLNTNVQYLAM